MQRRNGGFQFRFGTAYYTTILKTMKTGSISHEAISASAGSGKTFQLAHRYIRLLADGIKPDRIVALTFSRKAAGEIFDSIVKYLCQASASPDLARLTAERIEKPELGSWDFLRMLRSLLDSLHRLHVGTLDSFIISIIRAFPLELGIPHSFQILDDDGAEAKAIRREVLSRLFASHYVDQSAQREFLEAFKQATFGKEEKALERSLDLFVGKYRDCYQVLPMPDAWGNPHRIWQSKSPLVESTVKVGKAAERLRALLSQNDMPAQALDRWYKYIDSVQTYGPYSTWTRDIEYLSTKLLENMKDLERGEGEITLGRSVCRLSFEESQLALTLLRHVLRIEIISALRKTQGIFQVINQYERMYDQTIRRQGKLTFSDAQHLLTSANTLSGGALLSRLPSTDARLYIDYRLDCQLDHWLLDEFQDTSDLQWEVLRNLADEIFQDITGQRSFFYVGDVKQAIYGWRGGNARLFGKILEQYGPLIKQRLLSTSFRSSKPIIETVNRVFGNLPSQLPDGALTEWRKVWQEHRCQEEAVPAHGYAALIEPPCQGGGIKPGEEDRLQIVASLIEEIDPLSRGLTTAILVRTNESGKRVVDFLRRECPSMQVVHEGKATIDDNPVVSVLLSLVKFAAHPGDTFAWRHLQMSPLNRYFEQNHLNRENLPHLLLQEIQSSDLHTTLRTWGERLDDIYSLDQFGRKRLDDLLQAANEFDARNGPEINAFLRFIENYQLHDLAAQNTIRVMTIHQSKGLGFDLVILPDLQTRSITDAGSSDLTIARDPLTNRPLWALKMPRRLVARADPVLAAQLQTEDVNACFDALCVLYVALTRAKQGLYMITSFPGKNATALTSAALLKMQLCKDPKPVEGPAIDFAGKDSVLLYETGERQWYSHTPRKEHTPETDVVLEPPADFPGRPSRRQRLTRLVPSEQVPHELNAAALFNRDYYRKLDFGSTIHELLARVGWLGETDPEAVLREWHQESPVEASMKEIIGQSFRTIMSSDGVRQALSKPDGNVDLWRERPFEIVMDGQWVTGSFDRVMIFREPNGEPSRAIIIDFKTDEVSRDEDISDLALRYRSQLVLYGRALSRMINLDPSLISLQILFTHSGEIFEIPTWWR